MKKLLLPFALCFVFFATSFAQTGDDLYKKIDYLQVNQTEFDRFLKVADKDLVSGFRSLLENDDIQAWYLYKVKYPGGQESSYNFVSITTASSIDKLGDHFSASNAPGFVPSAIAKGGAEQLTKLATLVKSEIWRVEDSAFADTGSTPSRYISMDYMEVAQGKDPDYLMLEDEIAKPIHLERIERDRMAGWEVYSLVLPSGMNYGYNFATGNHFKELEHFEFGFNEEIIRQTMGKNSNVPELFETIYNTRDLIKVELWELVDHLQ
ncbi:hypothetical protein CK503_04635 [Aliifodinibius salipaludis]|uniref:Uncharacterized protein n=1 Tax=Fodinibius salipaludis TaxID=2032627 RepID=A0A2A2GD37_9BACT|nr:hypothetical protein [Aliifodinibius salipaludis]PAU94765.1 hypothetical protein CK503_04635 [Aliifodinibius salipaludis]